MQRTRRTRRAVFPSAVSSKRFRGGRSGGRPVGCVRRDPARPSIATAATLPAPRLRSGTRPRSSLAAVASVAGNTVQLAHRAERRRARHAVAASHLQDVIVWIDLEELNAQRSRFDALLAAESMIPAGLGDRGTFRSSAGPSALPLIARRGSDTQSSKSATVAPHTLHAVERGEQHSRSRSSRRRSDYRTVAAHQGQCSSSPIAGAAAVLRHTLGRRR